MEYNELELTLEEMLSIHRVWIISLYTDEHKSEREIVTILCDRGLPVTLSHIRKFFLDWDVPQINNQMSSIEASIPRSYSQPDDWELLPKPLSPPYEQYEDAYTFTSEEVKAFYETLPLPALPDHSLTSKASYPPKSGSPEETPSSRLSSLGKLLPEVPSTLEMYQLDVQNHERRALDLEAPLQHHERKSASSDFPLVRRDIRMRKKILGNKREKSRDNDREKKKRREN